MRRDTSAIAKFTSARCLQSLGIIGASFPCRVSSGPRRVPCWAPNRAVQPPKRAVARLIGQPPVSFGALIIGAPPLAPALEESARDHPGEQALGLVGPEPMLGRDLPAGDPAVGRHVVEDCRLDGIESAAHPAPVGLWQPQAPAHGLHQSESVRAASALQQPPIYQAYNHSRGALRVGLRDRLNAAHAEERILGRRSERQQIVQTQHGSCALLLRHQADPSEIRATAAQDHDHVARRAAAVTLR